MSMMTDTALYLLVKDDGDIARCGVAGGPLWPGWKVGGHGFH